MLYTHQGDALFLTGIDARSGATRWSRPATFSGPQPGIPLSVDVLDGKWLAYFAPVDESRGEAQLVLLDPAGGGTELARSDTKVFYSFPAPCDVDPASACVWAFTAGSQTAQFKLARGGQAVRQTGVTSSARQSIGDHGLVRFVDGTRVYVGVEKNGVLVWSEPEAKLFGERYSTNGGWAFDYSAATQTFVGSVGLSADTRNGGPVPMANSTVSVALDAATGAVRWSREGVDTFCDIDVSDQDSVDADALLACEWQGGQFTIDTAARSVTFDKPAMALAEIDVKSGQNRWTAPIGDVALDKQHQTPRLALVPDAVVLDRVAGAVRVSVTDGAESNLDPTVVAWRWVPVEFPQKVPWQQGSEPDYFTRRGVVLEGALGGQVTDAVTLPLPGSVGARFDDGLTVLTTAKGIAAYRI